VRLLKKRKNNCLKKAHKTVLATCTDFFRLTQESGLQTKKKKKEEKRRKRPEIKINFRFLLRKKDQTWFSPFSS